MVVNLEEGVAVGRVCDQVHDVLGGHVLHRNAALGGGGQCDGECDGDDECDGECVRKCGGECGDECGGEYSDECSGECGDECRGECDGECGCDSECVVHSVEGWESAVLTAVSV